MPSSSESFSHGEAEEDQSAFDTLITHLLAAKRSLSCLERVSRANHLVTSTRQALESHIILAARTNFVERGCKTQIRLLEQARGYLQGAADQNLAHISDIIQKLEDADARLQDTIDRLKATTIEQSLRPTGEDLKRLIDFVDESGLQSLLQTIKEIIDASVKSREGYEQSLGSLNDELEEVSKQLVGEWTNSHITKLRGTSDEFIPHILRRMEEAAEEMANNLESLVKHFDLCVTAIRQTDDGGAAAFGIIRQLPEGADIHLSQIDGVAEPISDEERREMLEVLQKDATEVDDVVNEVRLRAIEMEACFERVTEHEDMLEEAFNRKADVLKLLEDIGNKLPTYLAQGQMFLFRWDEDRNRIESHLSELQDLHETYAGFLVAYDHLIIEVGRRKDTDNRIRVVCKKALGDIENILSDEQSERDYFKQNHGQYLPVDIWPGLSAQPPTYDITVAEGDPGSIPDISASVVKQAIRRAELQKHH